MNHVNPPEKEVSRYNNGKPKESWEGGFLYLTGFQIIFADQDKTAGVILEPTTTFYVQKKENFVDVCLE